MKTLEELGEKEKNKWQSFNTKVFENNVRNKFPNFTKFYVELIFSKLSSKTWKGVVKKNKFDLPEHHENKVGVGSNSLTNRVITPGGNLVSKPYSSASASAANIARHKSGSSFK